MLSQRIFTAIVLILLLSGSLVADSPIFFILLLDAFVCIAAWEWAGLTGFRQTYQRMLYSFLLLAPLPLLYIYMTTSWAIALTMSGAVAWCVAAVMLVNYQAGGRFIPAGHISGYVTGFFVLVPAWLGLVWLSLQQQGPQLVLLFFGTVCLADIAAFAGGRRWGKHRLASRVSPGKTREGFYAGVIAASLPALLFVIYKEYSFSSGMWLIVLCVVCVFFSVIGDLFISMFKRHVNVKDSGQVLPGHGGVLDRIDSTLAAAPVFTTGIWMLEGRV